MPEGFPGGGIPFAAQIEVSIAHATKMAQPWQLYKPLTRSLDQPLSCTQLHKEWVNLGALSSSRTYLL
jgi:hypothetical protein